MDSHDRKRAQRTRERNEDGFDQPDKGAAAAARAEVVDILASALFTILLDGRALDPKPRSAEQHGERS